MTKADIVSNVAKKTSYEKEDVVAVVDAFMEEIRSSMEKGKNVYLRGFGSFIVKFRKEKKGRNISKNTTLLIPARNVPMFRPSKFFVKRVRDNVKVK